MNDLSNKDFEAGLVPGIASSPASSHILKTFFVSNQFPKWKDLPQCSRMLSIGTSLQFLSKPLPYLTAGNAILSS